VYAQQIWRRSEGCERGTDEFKALGDGEVTEGARPMCKRGMELGEQAGAGDNYGDNRGSAHMNVERDSGRVTGVSKSKRKIYLEGVRVRISNPSISTSSSISLSSRYCLLASWMSSVSIHGTRCPRYSDPRPNCPRM